MKNGFTLLEMMVAISIMAILISGGTLILFKTLGSRGYNQADLNINTAGSQIMESIEQSIKYSNAEAVGANDREDCAAAGVSGVTASTLSVSDSWGTSVYSLVGTSIASNSATISSSEVEVTNLEFVWTCVSGAGDKVKISFRLNDTSATTLARDFLREINMYNSGI